MELKMKNSNIMGDSLKNIFLVRGEGGGGGGMKGEGAWTVSRFKRGGA